MEVECKHHITVWISTYLSPVHPSALTHHSAFPTLTYFHYCHLYHCAFSKSCLLKEASLYFPHTHFSSGEHYICSWCGTAVAFLSGLLFPWIFFSVPIHYVAPLVFHCMKQAGCTSICRPLLKTVRYALSSVLQTIMDVHAKVKLKAKQVQECRPVKNVQLDFWFLSF